MIHEIAVVAWGCLNQVPLMHSSPFASLKWPVQLAHHTPPTEVLLEETLHDHQFGVVFLGFSTWLLTSTPLWYSWIPLCSFALLVKLSVVLYRTPGACKSADLVFWIAVTVSSIKLLFHNLVPISSSSGVNWHWSWPIWVLVIPCPTLWWSSTFFFSSTTRVPVVEGSEILWVDVIWVGEKPLWLGCTIFGPETSCDFAEKPKQFFATVFTPPFLKSVAAGDELRGASSWGLCALETRFFLA